MAGHGPRPLRLVAYLALAHPGQPWPGMRPKDAGYVGAHRRQMNAWLALQQVALPAKAGGPEHIAAYQGPCTRRSDARRRAEVQPLTDRSQSVVVVNTGGRPLGIDFDAQGRMLVADAFKGLLRVTGQGDQAKVETFLTQVDEPVRKTRCVMPMR